MKNSVILKFSGLQSLPLLLTKYILLKKSQLCNTWNLSVIISISKYFPHSSIYLKVKATLTYTMQDGKTDTHLVW